MIIPTRGNLQPKSARGHTQKKALKSYFNLWPWTPHCGTEKDFFLRKIGSNFSSWFFKYAKWFHLNLGFEVHINRESSRHQSVVCWGEMSFCLFVCLLVFSAAGLLCHLRSPHTNICFFSADIFLSGLTILWGRSSRKEAINDQIHFDFTDQDQPAVFNTSSRKTGLNPCSWQPSSSSLFVLILRQDTQTHLFMHKYEACFAHGAHKQPVS